MKSLTLLGVMMLCCTCYFRSTAQLSPPIRQNNTEKLSLFSRLPEKFLLDKASIEKLFTSPVSGTVKILLADNTFFEGTVTEIVQKNLNVASINIKSSNFDGALLTISKTTYENKSVKYAGRIVSMRYGDVLTLTNKNNQFIFSKEKQSLYMVE
ncbi:MAG: hypothetical protein WKF89_07435 [Chitinophagaceae bacterium]